MKKATRSHTSYIEQAEDLLKFLNKNPSVSKISLGLITPKKSHSKSVTKPKMKVLDTHLEIKINSKRYNQVVRVYGRDLEEILYKIKSFLEM